MKLNNFLTHYGIKVSTLEAIKKRVFIVGRFNTVNPKPSCYIFSKSGKESSEFNGSGILDYKSFIDLIQPTFTEEYGKVLISEEQFLPCFTLSPKKLNSENGDASYIIDSFNYFFSRATLTSQHPHYTEANGKNKTKDLLKDSAGETIYKQIKASLRDFCSFQHKNYTLLQEFSELLANNAGKSSLHPSLQYGVLFPENFPAKFIDFLYQEGSSKFDTEFIDFASHPKWKDPESIKTLEKLVYAFKNYFVNDLEGANINGLNLNRLKGKNNPLEKLKPEFKRSRDSYNMLRQIIRSRVLLSRVLEWAIDYFRSLESVKDLTIGTKQTRAIEKAILEGSDGLKKPKDSTVGVKAVDVIEDFKKNLPGMLKYIADYPSKNEGQSDEDYKKACENFESENKDNFDKFSEPIKDFVLEIVEEDLGNGLKKRNIQRIMEMEDQRESVFKAIEIFFIDVLIPKMFKKPGLTLEDLLKRFNGYEGNLFLTNSLLEVANAESIDHLFESTAGDFIIKNKEEGVDFFLKIAIDFVGREEVANNISKTQQTVQNFQTLRKLGWAENPKLGIGQFVPLLPPKEEDYIESVIEPATTAQLKLLPLDTTDNGVYEKVLMLTGEQKSIQNTSENTSLITLEKSESNPGSSMKLTLVNYYNTSDSKEKSMVRKELESIVKEDIKNYQTDLSKIHKRYASDTPLAGFKNESEAMVLARLLLLHKDELNLGKSGTNLFDLLLDLVENLNAEHPDLKKFWTNHSLTKYIEKEIFTGNGDGFGALEVVLKNQAEESLQNVVQFVSELQGVKYLFDFVNKKRTDCEIIVVNATHQEYLEWARANKNNLLKPNNLINIDDPDSYDPHFPALVFMSDLAFEFELEQKKEFLQAIKTLIPENVESITNVNIKVNPGNLPIFPPICMATSSLNANWHDEGTELNKLSQDVVAPVLILGPSLPLNEQNDIQFNTTLSSGYILCAHLLSELNEESTQKLTVSNIWEKYEGRFRSFGFGINKVTTLNSLVKTDEYLGHRDYSLAADYYLYLVSLINYVIKFSGRPLPLERGVPVLISDFYRCFTYSEMNNAAHESSVVLDNVQLYRPTTKWSLIKNINDTDSNLWKGVKLYPQGTNGYVFNHTDWFNNVIKELKMGE